MLDLAADDQFVQYERITWGQKLHALDEKHKALDQRQQMLDRKQQQHKTVVQTKSSAMQKVFLN